MLRCDPGGMDQPVVMLFSVLPQDSAVYLAYGHSLGRLRRPVTGVLAEG